MAADAANDPDVPASRAERPRGGARQRLRSPTFEACRDMGAAHAVGLILIYLLV